METPISKKTLWQNLLESILPDTVSEYEFNEKQQELYDTMSFISEDCYFASWIMGNEYGIWNALQTVNRSYGDGEISDYGIDKLRQLSQELGGWIIWVDDEDLPDMPIDDWGPRFVPMASWVKLADVRDTEV